MFFGVMRIFFRFCFAFYLRLHVDCGCGSQNIDITLLNFFVVVALLQHICFYSFVSNCLIRLPLTNNPEIISRMCSNCRWQSIESRNICHCAFSTYLKFDQMTSFRKKERKKERKLQHQMWSLLPSILIRVNNSIVHLCIYSYTPYFMMTVQI